MKFLIAFFLAAVTTPVYTSLIEPRVTYGQPAEMGQFPYMVNLLISNVMCGGTLIHQEWVITAAHCIAGQTGEITIRLGTTSFNNPQTLVTVPTSNAIVYPFYECAGLATDVALIKMPAVTLSDTIQPIKLPAYSEPLKNYANEDAMIMGWGGTGGDAPLPDRLQFANVQIPSQEQCSQQLDLQDSMMCATSVPSSICGGDSGGPLVLKSENILVGVTSFTVNGCESGLYNGFARLTSFLWWIKKNTGISY